MQKGWTGNYFEDFEVGARWTCPIPRTMRSGITAAYVALTGDRTPVYCGPSGRVHPLVSFHSIFGQTVRQISLNARANLGYADIRWTGPVSLGDTLSCELEIIGLKENSSGTTGVVWVKNTGRNDAGDTVLTFYRWVMVKKRGTDPTPYKDAPVVPTLPKEVAAEDLWVDTDLIPDSETTGGRWTFGDYEVGERVQHFDGMVVNPSDHMALTRLFQNSAKVHFDAHAMDGKPLVYGGVIISHAYASAFNGFENRLGIVAINSGAHANPTYADDTIYAWTDVLDTAEVADGVGALRLRTVAVKNLDPSREEIPLMVDNPKKPGRQKHHPNVVLDLDYWELMRA